MDKKSMRMSNLILLKAKKNQQESTNEPTQQSSQQDNHGKGRFSATRVTPRGASSLRLLRTSKWSSASCSREVLGKKNIY
jgi:hypothetical protein